MPTPDGEPIGGLRSDLLSQKTAVFSHPELMRWESLKLGAERPTFTRRWPVFFCIGDYQDRLVGLHKEANAAKGGGH